MRNYHVVTTIIRRWDLLKCERSDLTTPSHCLPLFSFSKTPSPSRCEQYETVTLLTPKIRFLMLMLCPLSFTPSSLESGRRESCILITLSESILWNNVESLHEIWTMLTKLHQKHFGTLKFEIWSIFLWRLSCFFF